MWRPKRKPKKERKQNDGITSWCQRVKATANLRRLFVIFFDVSRNAALSPADLSESSNFQEENSGRVAQAHTSTATLTRVASISIAAPGDVYEKIDFFSVQDGSASTSHSWASQGQKFLKVFKRRASNLPIGSNRASSSRNSVEYDVPDQSRMTTTGEEIDSPGEQVFIEQLQEELQILRERLENEEAEMEKLRSEVSTLRSGTLSLQRPPVTDGTIIVSRNVSVRSDGSQSCLDFSLSPSGMLKFEGQFRRSSLTSAPSLNKMRLDSFLSDAAAVTLRISDNNNDPEGINNEVLKSADLEGSKSKLASVIEGKEQIWKCEDEFDDFGIAEVKFVEFQSIERTNSSRHRVSFDHEEDFFQPQSITDEALQESRSPPATVEDRPVVSKSNINTEYTHNATDKPRYSRSLANLDIPMSEERQLVEMKFHALEEKLLGTLRSFKKKNITTSTATTGQHLGHSVRSDPIQEPFFSDSEAIKSTSNDHSVNGNIHWSSHQRAFVDFDKAVVKNPRVELKWTDFNKTRRRLDNPNMHNDESFESSVGGHPQVSEKVHEDMGANIYAELEHSTRGDFQESHMESQKTSRTAVLAGNDMELLQAGCDQSSKTGSKLSTNKGIHNKLGIMLEREPPLSPRGFLTSTFGDYSMDFSSTRESALPIEEVDLEEEVRQCLEYSRRLLQEEAQNAARSAREKLLNAYPLSPQKRFSREESFSVLSLSRQRRSFEKSLSSVGLMQERRPPHEDLKQQVAEYTFAPKVTSLYEDPKSVDSLKQSGGKTMSTYKDLTSESVPINKDWTFSEFHKDPYESRIISPDEDLHSTNSVNSEAGPQREDSAVITPTRLREALDSWDKKRADREVRLRNLSPKIQNSRRTRFYVEAANST